MASRILVCTDIASRGIDFSRVDIVINYDIPYTAETYQHRAARTGRFGKKGVMINIVAPSEVPLMMNVEKELKLQFIQIQNNTDLSSL